MRKASEIAEILLTYISVLLGVIAVHVFCHYGKISMEQVFFIDETILQMTWVKQIVLFIIITSLILTFAILLLPSKKLKIALSLVSVSFFIFVFSVYEYIRYNISYSTFYEDEYKSISPKDISFPENKRNLILIYLESMEQDYIGQNIKPYLDSLQKNNTSFLGFKQLDSANMTIGAQFASLCGLPLKKVASNKDLLNFMPTVVCVPDILKQAGYNLSYLKAADTAFAGAKLFAEQHSFDNIKGYDELSPTLKEKFGNVDGNLFGGLRDKMLFEAAKSELKKIQQPFMLSLTTLDMHHSPEYFVDETCQKTFGDIRDAVRCVDNNVKQFMEWLQQQDFFDNTTIVLIGDHIGHVGPSMYPRKAAIFNVIINNVNGLNKENHIWSTYDLAPTILQAIGIDVPYLGIGRSLFKSDKTLLEKYANNFNFMLMAKNRMYNDFDQKFDIDLSFRPYLLGTVLTNQQTADYIDIGNNTFCYNTTIMSLDIGKNTKDNMELETNILSLAETFDIVLNGHIIFSNKELKPQKRKLNIPINKEWIEDDGKVVIEVNFTQYNRNRPAGICFDNFVLKQKKG